MHAIANLPRTHFVTTHDSNLCPLCQRRNPVAASQCQGCGATVVKPARGAVSFWVLGAVDRGMVGQLARQVGRALGCPVVVQPGRLDPRPSERPAWHGRSGTVILNQMDRRQQTGCLTNVAILADPVASEANELGLYGYAYVDWGAACLSLQLVQQDWPDPATLVQRLLSICLHEIGHNLGLGDHSLSEGIQCAMVGDIPAHRQFDPASYPTKLCPTCLTQARERMVAFGVELGDNRFIPAAGALFAGRYELQGRAGEGGYGAVWRSRDLDMDQDVALKFVRSDRFNGRGEVDLVAEAAKARRLNHPNIVRVFDLARDAGAGGLVMDWIDGAHLEEMRQARPSGVFDAADLRAWATQLCGAVQAAHDGGVIHQDIKPENCLIDRRNVLHLTDFGLARTTDHPRASFLRGATLSVGTPGFCAPERIEGVAPGPAQDIYSIGATLYRLLTGQHARLPGENGSPAWDEKAASVNCGRASLGGGPKVPPVPEAWESTIAECLRSNPVQRPRSAADVARRLNAPGPSSRPGEAPVRDGSHPEAETGDIEAQRTRVTPLPSNPTQLLPGWRGMLARLLGLGRG